ncbi:hypothetical protein [Micromonospora aurantiaca (nom. illeg.)]|uniref:hypothetical protein n=1 Tax=Micromonospora aurantiaca (nom. illeg.) TaxID=47850 RepID=UPI0008280E06|nr:hypothetical protein [Micromonospora aurantiaca]SCL21298.1 hypothetical protein GA0070615_0037 [Micromonospora aurantiaca]SCL21431.1 hypothetical protein GA0070615_0071 [Micromonospora aurantiaca]
MTLKHLPDGTVQLEVTPAQARVLGADASLLLDWFDSALLALVALREGRAADMSRNDWHYLITHLEHRLAPRLDGLRDAVIRAHHGAGGSLADLALAMDVEKSTAQYRRDRVVKREPNVWETWARAGGPQHPGQPPKRWTARITFEDGSQEELHGLTEDHARDLELLITNDRQRTATVDSSTGRHTYRAEQVTVVGVWVSRNEQQPR